jgi:hypothetical protein
MEDVPPSPIRRVTQVQQQVEQPYNMSLTPFMFSLRYLSPRDKTIREFSLTLLELNNRILPKHKPSNKTRKKTIFRMLRPHRHNHKNKGETMTMLPSLPSPNLSHLQACGYNAEAPPDT